MMRGGDHSLPYLAFRCAVLALISSIIRFRSPMVVYRPAFVICLWISSNFLYVFALIREISISLTAFYLL